MPAASEARPWASSPDASGWAAVDCGAGVAAGVVVVDGLELGEAPLGVGDGPSTVGSLKVHPARRCCSQRRQSQTQPQRLPTGRAGCFGHPPTLPQAGEYAPEHKLRGQTGSRNSRMKESQIADVCHRSWPSSVSSWTPSRSCPAGKRRLLRVVVDGDGPDGRGPLLDDIAEASKALSAALDTSDAVGTAAYTLEVSSRGVSRPLDAAAALAAQSGPAGRGADLRRGQTAPGGSLPQMRTAFGSRSTGPSASSAYAEVSQGAGPGRANRRTSS